VFNNIDDQLGSKFVVTCQDNTEFYSIDFVAGMDMLEDEPLSSLNNISGMMVDSPNTANENDDVEFVVEKPMKNTQNIEENTHENEETNSSKRYHLVFKPSFTPISHRLRRKK
jgi:hypothetical protein